MDNLQPHANCPLDCQLHGGPRCVCNLIPLPADHAPISFGLRLGLDHFYGVDELPPCIRGTHGAAYWSVHSTPGEPVQAEE
jgi:hypothetical protein